ncbi:assimilatory sulfite reductase (NADPH) flavoprotein subunit [Marinicella sp. S1101]|uniref:assimilatory sulfite reductase (NADPH) flavoprotein subunit n=1 Tax=Marinicella marina TaxID=2996016 RepID=UPI0022609380|nr:assimilatory sulfite reductase (NADPH) flavoprotein subunit [Marinicella marina]MCX7552700.1 assimilatory sulfite reductase (NADPH) flavoprotein subunit [Marinicella marina]MDJ1139991.1 assimilatory sulfite reductase (NADPH) flavoprotein subunit [Marinicella marina]
MLTNLGDVTPIDQQKLSQLDTVLASLSAQQKTWLSGYLAGQVSTQTPPVAAEITNQPHTASSLTVLYGSQTGNAKSLANKYYQTAQQEGLTVQLVSMADFQPRQITKEQYLVLIVSTHGEGDAPDDAEILYEYLFSPKAPKLKQLHFSVLALGDSSYEQFCQTGIDFDQQLEKLGAQRMTNRVDCDLDYEEQAANWQQETLNLLIEKLKTTEFKGSNVVPLTTAINDTTNTISRKQPFAAEILASQRITTTESSKVVYHIELSLEGSNLRYQAGDSLGICAPNRADDVTALLQQLKLDPSTPVTFDKQQHDLQSVLISELEISLLNKKFLHQYAENFNLSELSQRISSHQGFVDLTKTCQLIDVMTAYPAAIDAQTLIDHLPKITPRLYSIASSHHANPDEVHLTIALVDGKETRMGLVSGSFHGTLDVGDQVNIFIEPNNHFKLPEDPQTAIIMIGPGTGVAPFRGFLQERQALKHTGDNWLFFGNPNFDHDFLYQLEWQQYLKTGLLSRIDLAFSRDQAEKIYVQHKIKAHSALIWQWLEKGAHIYLCGDKDHMAKDVEAELIQVIEQHGQLDNAEATAYLQQLKRQKRYQKDVY